MAGFSWWLCLPRITTDIKKRRCYDVIRRKTTTDNQEDVAEELFVERIGNFCLVVSHVWPVCVCVWRKMCDYAQQQKSDSDRQLCVCVWMVFRDRTSYMCMYSSGYSWESTQKYIVQCSNSLHFSGGLCHSVDVVVDVDVDVVVVVGRSFARETLELCRLPVLLDAAEWQRQRQVLDRLSECECTHGRRCTLIQTQTIHILGAKIAAACLCVCLRVCVCSGGCIRVREETTNRTRAHLHRQSERQRDKQ